MSVVKQVYAMMFWLYCPSDRTESVPRDLGHTHTGVRRGLEVGGPERSRSAAPEDEWARGNRDRLGFAPLSSCDAVDANLIAGSVDCTSRLVQ